MSHDASLLACEVLAATMSDTVLQTCQMMTKAKVGCAVILDGGRPVGIFSERDLLNRVVSAGKDPAKTRLVEVMTEKPVSLVTEAPLATVFSVFAKNDFRHIPITEMGKLVGIVSLSDAAKILSEVCKEEKYLELFVERLRARRQRPPA